jgi:hypothetical protein
LVGGGFGSENLSMDKANREIGEPSKATCFTSRAFVDKYIGSTTDALVTFLIVAFSLDRPASCAPEVEDL